MKLKVFLSSGKPVTKLSARQQERFIEGLSEQTDENVKLGMEMALTLLGYEVVEDGEEE
ncbi:hypothetical protein [Niallia sp. 03091]|uniref:hypothetical protein n=1 Tax=Niallia sp. 03091 TaxID=3458059 RepID=UPI0040450B30